MVISFQGHEETSSHILGCSFMSPSTKTLCGIHFEPAVVQVVATVSQRSHSVC